MNHEQFIRRMSEIGYSREGVNDLVWLSRDASDLVSRSFNFVPTGDGQYEIWTSGDWDDFFRVGPRDNKFRGTLSDAYQYVFEDGRKRQQERARIDQLARIVRDTIGPRGRVHVVDNSSGEVVFTMYDAFGFKCALDKRYGSFGLVLPVEAGATIRSFLGREISMNSDLESIQASLRLIDEYCRLRLPDKYLERYDEAHPSTH